MCIGLIKYLVSVSLRTEMSLVVHSSGKNVVSVHPC